MTVYVDNMRAKVGRMIFCHMIADSDDELHGMADAIGVDRRWHQARPKHSVSHYDIVLAKRALAVQAGAAEITLRQCGAMSVRQRLTGLLGDPGDAVRWHLEERATLFADLMARRAAVAAGGIDPVYEAYRRRLRGEVARALLLPESGCGFLASHAQSQAITAAALAAPR